MFKKSIPIFIRAITPVHAGSGNDLGVVDLPIQREGHTGFPKIESSTLKGSIRDAFELEANGDEKKEIKIHLIFGYDGTNASPNVKSFFENEIKFTQFASSIGFTDARILLFPVKSLKGVFAYATSPLVLKRLEEDLKMGLFEDNIIFEDEDYKINGKPLVSTQSKLIVESNQVVLEEYLFDVERSDKVNKLAKKLATYTGIDEEFLKERLIILEDDDFTDFVKLSTEVITRIKINNETGTVDTGALFTEEYIPSETIMYSLVMLSPVFVPKEINEELTLEKVEKFFRGLSKTFQIGGNETIGKGFIEVNLWEEGKNG